MTPDINSSAVGCYVQKPLDILGGCILPDLAGATGGDGLWGVIVGGGLLFMMYIASGRKLGTATVLTILLGGLMIPVLPGNYQGLAFRVIIVGLAAGFFAVLERYVMEGVR